MGPEDGEDDDEDDIQLSDDPDTPDGVSDATACAVDHAGPSALEEAVMPKARGTYGLRGEADRLGGRAGSRAKIKRLSTLRLDNESANCEEGLGPWKVQ